jgi:hypothetical protein
MPEKVSPESEFPPVVNFVRPASVFRHQGQSGTAGHGLVRHCPAMHFGEWKHQEPASVSSTGLSQVC